MQANPIVAAIVLTLFAAAPAAHAADAAAGKAKAAACAGCHGPNGEGSGPNPAIAGMPEAKFVQAIKDYKSGKRPNPVMKASVASLDDADMANLAAHYASLKKK